MPLWRDLVELLAAKPAPLNSGARAGGRRLSTVTAIRPVASTEHEKGENRG